MTRPRRSVLIVDDDDGIRAVLDYTLGESGYDVLEAASAEEAWDRFREASPDVVITDVRMAGMSGMDLLERIKDRSPVTPVIVLTAYGNVPQAVEAMKRGAHDYVTKPFDREALKISVRKAVEYSEVRRENIALRNELAARFRLSSIVGKSAAMQEVFRLVARVAPTDSTVLIRGETGTGKELIARAIHHSSHRASKNFVTVNCTAIPRELLESELFGHVKGAFTGATSARTGKFELADGGTLFLDEIGDIDLELQKKLLRALQEREIDKVGATEPIPVDVRVVAATNQPLAAMVERGSFRKDLYYRLDVIPIDLPALRERKEDIPDLVRHFLEKFGASGVTVEEEAMARLVGFDWPGNVRELENTVERALILKADPSRITAGDIVVREAPGERIGQPAGEVTTSVAGAETVEAPERPGAVPDIPEGGIVLEDVERELIRKALEQTGGNQSAAARLLGISRQTLIYRMQKHGLRAERAGE